MVRVSLAPYSMRLSSGEGEGKTYYSPTALPPVAALNGTTSLAAVFDEFLQRAQADYHESPETQRMLGVQNWTREGRTSCGLFRAGEWGYGALLIDTDHELDDYSRRPSQAELLPFFFAHHYAPDRTQTILLLQKFKQYGVLSAFQRAFTAFLAEIGLDVRLELQPLVPADYVQQLIDDGSLRTIQFIKHEIPADVVEAFDHGTEEVPGSLVLSVRAARAANLPFGDWISSQILQRTLENAEQIEILNAEFDEVKFTVNVGGTERTIAMDDLHAIRPAYPVTEQVEFGDDGHPTWDSIRTAGLELLQSIRTSVWQNEGADGED